MPARAICAVIYLALASPALAGAAAKPQSGLEEDFDHAEATVKSHLEGSEVVVKKAVAWEQLDEAKYKAMVKAGYITLPNGKKVKAKRFFSAVNHIGKALASIGTHLINDVTKAIQLGRNATFADRLKVAEATILSLHNPAAQWKKANLADVQAQQKDLLLLRTSLTEASSKNQALATELSSAAGDGGTATRVSVKKPWALEAGQKKYVGAYVRGTSELWGDGTGVGLHTEAVVGGHILSGAREILNLKADINAPKAGKLEVKLDGSVAGKSVFSVNKSAKDNLALTDRLSKTFDLAATVPIFSIGIVHVVAKMGFTGTAGFEYGAALAPGALGAHVTPFVKATAYVQAAIALTIPIAEAGAKGELILIEDELELAANATIVPAKVQGKVVWGIYSQIGVHNALNMLQGDLSIFAKLHYPCMQDAAFKICSKEVHHPIVESKGIKVQGDLFREKKFTSLGVALDKLKI